MPELPDRTGVLIVGGGQAGLSMSWHLTQAGVDHLVLERERVAYEWQEARWDSFCLVTPNWQCALPGFPYAGDDPDGFMVKDEIVDYVQAYARSFAPPLVEGVEVLALHQGLDGGFVAQTNAGQVRAGAVVVATGGYHEPIVPEFASRLPVEQLHSSQYKRPSQLRDGAVLVVGTGQSGAQIAEDLHRAGRQVHLAIGEAPRCARVHRGRDVVAWLQDMGQYDVALSEHPLGEAAREKTNHYVTGRDGGHDLDLRLFAREGMRLYGRATGSDGTTVTFAPTLRASLDAADEVYRGINASIDKWIAEHNIDAPEQAPYVPVWEPGSEPLSLDLAAEGITSVVWAIGYRADWSWLHVPVLDAAGHPRHLRGVSEVPGLCFLGLPWLHTWGSGRFASVGRDAEHLLGQLAGQVGVRELRLPA